MPESTNYKRKPDWLRIRLPHVLDSQRVIRLLNEKHLHTICTSGMCPNRGECWGAGTATFMIGGNICTRNCRFCNVTHGRPKPLDAQEIEDIATAIDSLHLRHAVITSVDRDDLPDLGAEHWVQTIKTIRQRCPGVTMEVLIPDFQGRLELVDLVIDEKPEVISHNLETVRRLTPQVRTHATYDTSLAVLRHIAERGVRAKSGIMLGLGETRQEIIDTMDDLRSVGCEVMTIGQYLQPAPENYPLQEYVHPDVFEEYRQIALDKGFCHVESSPLVRSSYHADRHVPRRD